MYTFTVTTVEDLTPQEHVSWENFTARNEENSWSIYQTSIWTKFFSYILPHRAIALYLMKDRAGTIMCGAIGYKYPLFYKYSWLYFPRGPIAMDNDMGLIKIFLDYFAKHLSHLVWIRFDPALLTERHGHFFTSYHKAHKAYHPDKTLILDLKKSQETLLKEMHPKGRYNIKVAVKNNVKISGWTIDQMQQLTELSFFEKYDAEIDPIRIFAHMMQETGTRDGFSVHGEDFYRQMLYTLENQACILLAHKDGQCIGGGLFVMTSTSCIYYYGASLHQYRTLMAPYLVQWKAIQYAQSLHKKYYDFLGIGEDHPSDPLYGVTQFKKKFGGTVRTYVGTYELILHRPFYILVIFIKKMRTFFKR